MKKRTRDKVKRVLIIWLVGSVIWRGMAAPVNGDRGQGQTYASPLQNSHFKLELEEIIGNPSRPYNHTIEPGKMDGVIFEPMERVQLSLSTFQVVTVLDFRPMERTLTDVIHFIRLLMQDMSNWAYHRDPSSKVITELLTRLEEHGVIRVRMTHLHEVAFHLWKSAEKLAKEYIGLLELANDHPAKAEEEPYLGYRVTEHGLIYSLHCIKGYIGSGQYPLLDHRATENAVDFKQFCGCMRYYSVLPLAKDCPENSTIQDYTEKVNRENQRSNRSIKETIYGDRWRDVAEYPNDTMQKYLTMYRGHLTGIQENIKRRKEAPKKSGPIPTSSPIPPEEVPKKSSPIPPKLKSLLEAAWEKLLLTQSTPALNRFMALVTEACFQEGSPRVVEDELCKLIQKWRMEKVSDKKRQKRGIGTILLGIYTYFKFRFTDRSIKHLKANVARLDKNQQQDHQALLASMNILKMAMLELGQHRRILDYLRERSLVHEQRLQQLHDRLQTDELIDQITHEIQVRIENVRGVMQDMFHEKDMLGDTLSALTTQRINPKMISPPDLKLILSHVLDKLKGQPRLSLLGGANGSLWHYYDQIRIIPTFIRNHLVLALQIPLTDISTHLDVYRAHSFPLLNPDLGVRFTYELEGNYIAIGDNSTYYQIPDDREVMMCQAAGGGWCAFTAPLVSLKKAPNCLAAIYLKNTDQVGKQCQIHMQKQDRPQAVRWKPHTWFLSVLKEEKVDMNCLIGEERKVVQPPHVILKVPPSCSVIVGDYLYLPPTVTLNVEVTPAELTRTFMAADLTYKPLGDFRLFHGWGKDNFTPEEMKARSEILLDHDTLTIPEIHDLMKLDYKYPKQDVFTKTVDNILKPLPLILFGLLALGILIGLGYLYCRYAAVRGALQQTGILGKVLPASAHKTRKGRKTKQGPKRDSIFARWKKRLISRPVPVQEWEMTTAPFPSSKWEEAEYEVPVESPEKETEVLKASAPPRHFEFPSPPPGDPLTTQPEDETYEPFGPPPPPPVAPKPKKPLRTQPSGELIRGPPASRASATLGARTRSLIDQLDKMGLMVVQGDDGPSGLPSEI